jgi:3-deoxy-D-manno-octulosonate 8-phosphate phosphatase (KDO 8-P phosphatase)
MRTLELQRRARQIRFLLTDCDGVLTDTHVCYSESGEVTREFSIRDGLAVVLLRRVGIETGIISGESSESLRRRAETLRISQLHVRISSKAQRVRYIAELSGLSLDQIAYIGDDVDDLELMVLLRESSLVAAPANASLAVRQIAHYSCVSDGGNGAFRDFADWILKQRGDTAREETIPRLDNHSFIRILSQSGAK